MRKEAPASVETAEALREIREQVRILGLATRDMVWCWDARTGSLVHNEAFAAALGELPDTREAAIAWWEARIHPADRERTMERLERAERAGEAGVSCGYRFRLPGGNHAQIEDRTCLLRDGSGRLARVLGTMRDVTQSRRVEEANARFSRIMENTTDLVAMTSAGGLILYMNAAGLRMLGWPADGSIVGTHVSAIFPDWAAEIVIEEGMLKAVEQGSWSGETAVLTRAGEETPVSQVVISHFDAEGQVEFLSTIIRDIGDRKRAELERIEEGNRHRAAIRASGQVMFDWNSSTNEVTYGGDVAGVLGYEREELAGGLDSFRTIVHAEDLEAFDSEVARVVATRDPFRLSVRVRHKAGRILHVETKGYFFLDRLGQFGRMVGFLADVTEAQQARMQLASAHETLEMRVAERTAELARANAAIREGARQQGVVASLGQRALAGVPLEALLPDAAQVVRDTLEVDFCTILKLAPDGKSVIPIAEAGWPEPMDQAFGVGLESASGYTLLARCPVIVEDFNAETRFKVPEITRRIGARSSVSVVIESGGQPMGVLIGFTLETRSFARADVDFLQSVANVLTAAMDRQRAEEIVSLARIQAEEANRAKNEFLSRMSHELRTPLNAILGFSQLLEIDEPTPTQAESVSHILKAGHHLLTLINEVLDIARIESGRLALAPAALELPAFIRECVEATKRLAEKHQVAITVDPRCETAVAVLADPQRLKQVLLNLLSNAVKYNRPNGRVLVTLESTGGRVRISVADTGYGIPADKLDKLFVPFERLGAESTGVDGSGIGLALAQRIVAALEGELGVDTIAGEGSTFWIDLPRAAKASGDETEGRARDAAAGRVQTLLYVEDEDLNQKLVERILSQQTGYELIPVMHGELALESARRHRPDLILLDLNLPDISGSEVLRRLKADPELWTIPVVMISADVTANRIDELMELGASGYLTKPYRVREFLDCLEQILS